MYLNSIDDDELLGSANVERSQQDRDHRKNVWNITKEQLNYYTTQFFSMQTDPEGVIPGNQVLLSFDFAAVNFLDLYIFNFCLKFLYLYFNTVLKYSHERE